MTLNTFFEKFALFADAPDAVAAMRELVLQLAVRGNLTDQAKSETCAEQLKLAESFRVLRGRRDAPDEEDIPFDTPSNWGWVAVGDSMNMINGKAFKPEDWSPEGTPIIRIQNLNNENAPFNRCKTEVDAKVHVNDGEFLISWSGTPGTSFGAFVWNRGFAYLNQHIFRCELVEGVFVKEFLRLAINARLDEMISHAQGAVGLRHITKGKLESIRLPLPPLAEQKRIVAKVDELMALCDRLEVQQQEREQQHTALSRASLARFADAPTPANLQLLFHSSFNIHPSDLRKSILTLAVQGKLVPQDPDDEPAEEAIRRVPPQPRPARYDKRSTANIQGIAALSVGPTECEIPAGWSCVPLIQIARLESGHTPSRSRPDWWGGDVSWVGVVDARLHNGKTIFETLQHTNEEGLANSAARMLPTGTVCVSRTASVGYVTILGKPMATSQDFVNWVPSEAVTSDWLQLAFTSEKDAFNRFSKGAVHQTIYYPEWLSMHAMLPPLAEQRRIVAKVEQLMALVDALETQLSASRATAKNLLDALVAELTSGSQKAS
jgi:type I restriction enzyme S subunit